MIGGLFHLRLFIAILLDEPIKNSLYDIEEKLKSYAKGSFTDKDNLHLTVNFIGETNQLDEVKHAMVQAVKNTNANQFSLSIKGCGTFKRNEGDIYWIGVEKENTLWNLQKTLVKELKKVGFANLEDREYKPHLTLGRRITAKESFHSRQEKWLVGSSCIKEFETDITPLQMEVNKISLMKSEHLQDKLIYTEIYHINLD